MSTYYAPKIVTSGLVLCLDAANSKSYPTGGTTWFDLSGNGKHATLYNSPVWSNVPGLGNFSNFVGSQYIQVENSPYSVLPAGNSSRTLVCGFCTPSSFSTNFYMTVMMYGQASTDQAWGCMLVPNGTTTSAYVGVHTWAGCIFGTTPLSASTDYIASIHYNDAATPRTRISLNSVAQALNYGQGKISDYALNTGTAYSPVFGTRIAGPTESLLSGGKVYFTHIYNRDLSDNEVQQNFSALRGRLRI